MNIMTVIMKLAMIVVVLCLAITAVILVCILCIGVIMDYCERLNNRELE